MEVEKIFQTTLHSSHYVGLRDGTRVIRQAAYPLSHLAGPPCSALFNYYSPQRSRHSLSLAISLGLARNSVHTSPSQSWSGLLRVVTAGSALYGCFRHMDYDGANAHKCFGLTIHTYVCMCVHTPFKCLIPICIFSFSLCDHKWP